jgi:HSP20 family protein
MELRVNGYSPGALAVRPWTRLWDELEEGERAVAPRADVTEDAEGYHFYFEMPGLRSDSVEVRMEDRTLIVDAERKRPEWPKDTAIHIAERAWGKFHRAFNLPEDAAHDNVRASYRDGILEVTVPKRPEAKPVKIKVELN